MPRADRILSEGAASLCDEELLKILLGGPDPLLAPRLLMRGLPALARASVGEILFTQGVSAAHAMRLLAALELGRRVALAPAADRPRLLHASALAELLWARLAFLPHEEFWMVALTARLQEIQAVKVAAGGLTQCSVTARDAFAPAVMLNAAAVAFAHNHPSGDPTPSSEDLRLQMLLGEAGNALGIRVVDHLVVAQSGVHSAIEGMLPPFSPTVGVG
jgi:DNA repair protein RadC